MEYHQGAGPLAFRAVQCSAVLNIGMLVCSGRSNMYIIYNGVWLLQGAAHAAERSHPSPGPPSPSGSPPIPSQIHHCVWRLHDSYLPGPPSPAAQHGSLLLKSPGSSL